VTPPADIVLWRPGASDGAAWIANAAPGSHARLAAEPAVGGGALRFEFRLAGHGAWAIARCEQRLRLPPHYVVTLRVRGDATPSELQLKLVDPSGANVWWWRRARFAPETAAQPIVFRRAGLRFAWGPRSGGEPDEIGAVELAVAADAGAAGTLWIEDLRIEPREDLPGVPRVIALRASSAAPGQAAEGALAPDGRAAWRPEPDDPDPWLELDLGARREWGGLALDLAGIDPPPRCRVLASDDGASWSVLADDTPPAPRCWLRTGEAESRFVRLALPAPFRGGVTRLRVVPIELAVSPERHASAVARSLRRGRLPRHLLGEHRYWALVGADGDTRKALLGEDGALEVDAESFTLEPFLRVDGRIVGWADVETRASLAAGALPLPTLRWTAPGVRLAITAFAAGAPGSSTLVARYVATNDAAATRDVRLVVAIRPFQVTPAWQSLNLRPALAPITSLVRDGARVRVNGERTVVAVSAPDRIETPPEGADPGAFLDARCRDLGRAEDPLGFAEAAFVFDLRLAPGASEAVVLAVPLHAATPDPPAALARADAADWGEARLAETEAAWTARLARIPVSLPSAAAPLAESLRASVAWILVNREGPRIQPGPRCYRRSWIRDGALTGTALAELGFAEEARAFLRWYAPFQDPDGRVPCAVDRQGVDRAVEHDSHGQLVWAVVELWRLAGDEAFLRELWPHAQRAAEAIAALREERLGPSFRGDPRFGLLPESISHEGYSGRPVHSFWDDFFALRAFADAADAAAALGDVAARRRFEGLRDAMRADVRAAVSDTISRHHLDVVPGSVELGDFDPTSTAIAFDPCGEEALLPAATLERTFARQWGELEARWTAEAPADAYTAYEARSAVAFLRLGWRERALALLAALVADQRPPGWRQWPEVTTRDPGAPRFLGDLPHGWIASSFLRSARRLVVDERRDGGVLVVAAGVPEAWLRDGDGVRCSGLPTLFGVLDLHLRAEGEDRVRVSFGGSCRPPGGLVLVSSLARPLRELEVDGRTAAAGDPQRVVLRELPRELVLRY
jgi:hypothetical protein